MAARLFGLILALTISAYATEPEDRIGEVYTDSLGRLCKQIGDYVQYANPDAFIKEPTDRSPNWPILTELLQIAEKEQVSIIPIRNTSG